MTCNSGLFPSVEEINRRKGSKSSTTRTRIAETLWFPSRLLEGSFGKSLGRELAINGLLRSRCLDFRKNRHPRGRGESESAGRNSLQSCDKSNDAGPE